MEAIKKYMLIILFSIALTVPNVFAICMAYPRDLGIDYLGWIVGILAFLTTILLGWQLFSLFQINKLKDEVENIRNQTFLKAEECLVEIHATMALHISSFPNYLKDRELIYKYTMNCLSMIVHFSKIGDYKRCERQINAILQKLSQTEKVQLPQQYRTMLVPLIVEVQKCSHVSNREHLWEILDLFCFSNDKEKQ